MNHLMHLFEGQFIGPFGSLLYQQNTGLPIINSLRAIKDILKERNIGLHLMMVLLFVRLL